MTEDGYLKYTYSMDGMQEGVILLKKPEVQPIPAAVEGNIYVYDMQVYRLGGRSGSIRCRR